MKDTYTYYHFKGKLSGERYFKVDWERGVVRQIVLESGKAKKGRPHMKGIHELAISSFRGSYYWFFERQPVNTEMKICTEEEFKQAAISIIQKFIYE